VANKKIEMSSTKLRLDDVEMVRHEHEKKWYESRIAHLQLKMLRVQQAYHHQKRRALLVFEGWDAGGKGGSIRRLTEKLDPRGFQVHAIGAPTPVEQGKHYLYRFWNRLPAKGNIAVFDRSWYGRVLVERVEGFAAPDEWKRAYDEINEFERLLADDGVRIIKFFMHISKGEQLRRFEERLQNPYKRWKLTSDDLRNRDKWDAYVDAVEEMFDRTSTSSAPWNAIGGNYKWYARTQVLELATSILGHGVDLSVPIIDPEVVELAFDKLGLTLDPPREPKKKGKNGKGKDKKANKDESIEPKKGKKAAKAKAKKGKDKKAAKVAKAKAKKADKKAKKAKKNADSSAKSSKVGTTPESGGAVQAS